MNSWFRSLSGTGYRHAARVKNPGGQVVLGGDNVVEIGLTDPPKSGGGAAALPPLPPTLLHACIVDML